MTMHRQYGVLSILLAGLLLSPLGQAQETISAQRESRPIYPATGTWWSELDGNGRWGVQVEVQENSLLPEGLFTAAVFSYEADNPEQQAWYVSNQAYEFNPNWRADGFIGRMQMDLRRTEGGTCLVCPDGQRQGETVPAEVRDVEIIFQDATNATLRVGNINHRLSKAEYVTTQGAGTQEFWARPFQVQFRLQSPVISDYAAELTAVGVVEPGLNRAQATFRDRSGWDVYQFQLPAEFAFLTIAGPRTEPAQANFELYVHPELNEYYLVLVDNSENQFVSEMRLFPLSRYVVEGRPLRAGSNDGLPGYSAEVLLVNTPSMRAPNNQVLPYPLGHFEPGGTESN